MTKNPQICYLRNELRKERELREFYQLRLAIVTEQLHRVLEGEVTVLPPAVLETTNKGAKRHDH